MNHQGRGPLITPSCTAVLRLRGSWVTASSDSQMLRNSLDIYLQLRSQEAASHRRAGSSTAAKHAKPAKLQAPEQDAEHGQQYTRA